MGDQGIGADNTDTLVARGAIPAIGSFGQGGLPIMVLLAPLVPGFDPVVSGSSAGLTGRKGFFVEIRARSAHLLCQLAWCAPHGSRLEFLGHAGLLESPGQ